MALPFRSFKAFFCFLVVGLVQVQAQNSNQNSGLESALKYQKQYPDQQAILVKSETNIEFKLDPIKKKPIATEKKEGKYISLKLNNYLNEYEFYDDNSEIKQAWLQGDNNEDLDLDKTCGNREVEGMFVTDSKICKYDLFFPSVGDTRTLSVQKEYSDLKYFTSVYFHENYPAATRTVTFSVPDNFDIELREFNFDGFDIKKTVEKKLGNTKYTYSISNISELKRENDSPGYSHTYPHLLVLSKSYTLQGQTKPLISSVTDLYSWYASLVKEVKNDREILEPTVTKILEGKTTDSEKIKAIYYWVQDNIRYIAFENGIAGFKPEAAHLVFQKKYGDCKGMANLTKEMLKIAGYDARLTWIGTNDVRYDYTIPSLAIDNHMICTVLQNDQKLILDPTEKFISFEDFGERIQGRPIMIENGDAFILDKVPMYTKERNLVNLEQNLQIKGNNLIGSAKVTYNGEIKTSLLNFLNLTKTASQQELLERVVDQGRKNFNITKLTPGNLTDREKPLSIDYDFEFTHKAASFDNELYVNIDNNQEYKDSKIDDDRQSDLVFHEKVLRKTKIKVQVPAGYKVSHLPASFEKQHGSFAFKLNYKLEKGEIVYEKVISVEDGIVKKKDFANWNACIKELRKAYADQIVFTKL